jgi:hypothetical protein
VPEQIIQSSFNSGEWSPNLFARVDIAKYRSGAALLQNFFVDYRGGASTRPGTKYILQCKNSAAPVRLIPFQASFSIGYVLEFGQNYIRFYFQGAPVLETATSITAAAVGPPEVFTDAAHGYANGDWIFVDNAYYIVANATTNTFTLIDLFGNVINTNPFTLPAAAQRVYTLTTPYLGSELALIKFAQNVNTLILCHPNHLPFQLVLNTATNWTLSPITFGATISAPGGLTLSSTLGAGTVFYSYVVTSVDENGQESGVGASLNSGGLNNMSTTAGSNEVSWLAVTGAQSYNVYKAVVSYFGVVPSGVQYGFIGNVTGTAIIDTNIGADFSQTPPIEQNPFAGSSVATIQLTVGGSAYSPATTVVFTGGAGIDAAATANVDPRGVTVLTLISNGNFRTGSGSPAPTATVVFTGGGGSGAAGIANIQLLTNSGGIAQYIIISVILTAPGSGYTSAPAVSFIITGAGVFTAAIATCTVGAGQIDSITLTNGGEGFTSAPAISFANVGTGSGATAIATIGASGDGNPTVPGFFQQRLVLAGQVLNPQGFEMSQPGIYFNFDTNTIVQPADAISGTLISGQLNTIKAMVPQPAGLLMFTDRNDWLINGGSNGSAVAPASIVANAQSFNGISDVPPIVSNFDILYVQSKGSIVRDAAYNIYANVYTGTDISIISSHLFYGFTIKEWAWAEEPFKVVWAVRNDGVMLTLTFLKEQEFTGWAHSTTAGLFQSVATIIENTVTAGEVDAIYTVVQRTINGETVQYIERVVERTYPNGVQDAWCVDCGIEYMGTAELSFTGAQFLGGATVTGLQTDDQGNTTVITPFTMPANGAFTLPAPPVPATGYVKVILGIGFIAQLQTLPLEIGEPTVQGKVKKINEVDVRVANTLGLSIGSSFNNLVAMQDLIIGQVSSMLTGQDNQVVTGLVNGDARTLLDPTYTVPGQYCIEQSQPYPASILGVIPNVTVGDTERRDR